MTMFYNVKVTSNGITKSLGKTDHAYAANLMACLFSQTYGVTAMVTIGDKLIATATAGVIKHEFNQLNARTQLIYDCQRIIDANQE